MDLVVRTAGAAPPGAQEVEVVERKGLGHPDSICDALAEQVCVRLCRHYRERFGAILHHNVDKILLCAGAARPGFGGGEVTAPIELYLGGRATSEYRGEVIPVAELATEACQDWLRANLRALDVERDVRIVPRIRPGSGELAGLLGRGEGGVALANDTSCGAGFAPPTDLERVVLAVESALNHADTKARYPAIGEDVKVMGVRRCARIELSIACAMVDRFVPSLDDYVRGTAAARDVALEAARQATGLEVDAVVNAADDLARGDVYLTVTGTSAEAGDDGEVGRGNRVSGLITPYRPMTLEAAAGKNPVNHVGKLYNVAAARMAAGVVDRVPDVLDASCVLVSRIGHPIDDPQLADVRLVLERGRRVDDVRAAVHDVVTAELARFPELCDDLLDGRVSIV